MMLKNRQLDDIELELILIRINSLDVAGEAMNLDFFTDTTKVLR